MCRSIGKSISTASVRVEAGLYWIGNDTIPQAGPRHQRYLDGFSIDAKPVSLGHMEVFVASGAYFDNRWWTDSPRGGASFLKRGSVDERCRDIGKYSVKIARRLNPRPRSSADVPAVGMTWMEAAAVCRFFDARLPLETEWEVAMQTKSQQSPSQKNHSDRTLSRWGCELHLEFLEEWTADAFTTRHWRDSLTPESSAPTSRLGVCLRGSTQSMLFSDAAYRSSGDPLQPGPFRGFRRVWSKTPTQAQVSSNFCESTEQL